jgi:hypothetical protein
MSTGADARPKTPTMLKKATTRTNIGKAKSRTTVKRLPWIDGKSSRPLAIPGGPLSSDTSSMSPSTRPPTRRPSAAVAPKHITSPKPGARKESLAAQSGANSSPSPVTRHQLSQARRPFFVRKLSPPPKFTTSHRPSVSHEPLKRLSVVQYHDEQTEEDDFGDDFGDVRPRADSLAPVPDHLEWSDTSDSMFKGDAVSSRLPGVVSRVHMSPSQPAPTRTALERVGNRRISNAIEGLEDIVHEAVEIAEEITDRRHVEDICEIIEDAKAAIHDATEDPMRHLMATTLPLEISSTSGEVEDVRRILPEARNGLLRDSASFDWAYSGQAKPPSSRSSSPSSLSDTGERGRARLDTQSDLRLLPPQPIRTTARDHVDFVLRPIARDHSRGRPRHNNEDPAVRIYRHRRRHNHKHRSRSSSRHRHFSSSISQGEISVDEENTPAHAYGNELSIRDQAHHHTFNLRRHHRRQPIARNWTTGKKRLTAIIACINTALLGIIVGIYASESLAQKRACADIEQAGEVPRIQYVLADENHHVVVGNAV